MLYIFEMKIFLLLSVLFCTSHHPVSLICILILMTVSISTFMTFFLKNSWLNLILILIILGGMLILFIYVASLASNESFSKNKMIYLMPFLILMPSFPMNFFLHLNDSQLLNMFSSNNSYNNIMAILYLLMSLLIVIEIVSGYKAPFRSKM